MKAPTCADCGKRLRNRRAKRCTSCEQARRAKPPATCVDCKKKLGNRRATRCNVCESVRRSLARAEPEQNRCLDCGKPISHAAKQCRRCSHMTNPGPPPQPKGEPRRVRAADPVCPDCGGVKGRRSARCNSCAQIERHRGEEEIPNLEGTYPMNSWERRLYGCIVTFENDAGKRLVVHRTGAPRKAAVECCDAALRLDGSFRIVCVSTPETVHTDLKGYRLSKEGRTGFAPVPETQLLRGEPLALLHPRLKQS